ncbi:MAG TPA: zinc ribbon domain-containing protein, partial [Mycobacterium sp.]|nr:zinc ribbon domain-containing protein [Mycobacterium sp.]
MLVIVALLRWQAPLIALSALGFPLLFQIYLQESDVYDDLPVRALLLTAVTGAGLGVGWALLTGPIVARSYTVGAGLG